MGEEVRSPGVWVVWALILVILWAIVRLWPKDRLTWGRIAVKYLAYLWVTMTAMGLLGMAVEHWNH